MMIEMFPEGSIYPRSMTEVDGTGFALVRRVGAKLLMVQGNAEGFQGQREGGLLFCPLSPTNAAILRERLPWLRPQPLGVSTSAGCGDRLGLATPGHIRALRNAGELAPILAQQSMRENARTGRTPQQVLDQANLSTNDRLLQAYLGGNPALASQITAAQTPGAGDQTVLDAL